MKRVSSRSKLPNLSTKQLAMIGTPKYSLLFLFVLLASGALVVATHLSFELLSPCAVASDEVGELLEFLVLVLHGARAQGQRADEFLQNQGSLLHLKTIEEGSLRLCGGTWLGLPRSSCGCCRPRSRARCGPMCSGGSLV